MKYKDQINCPDIDWNQDGHPVSERYQDVYYSAVNGLAETDHVFINGNNLLSRFEQLQPGEQFRIFECGFGTGLNFLRSYWHWERLAVPGKLIFTSIEAQPLTTEQLERALTVWQSAMPQQISRLLAEYDHIRPGLNRLQLSEQVILEILVFNAENLKLSEAMNQTVDAIFMDGFAPSKNPEMWQLDLCRTLYRIAKPGASLATYSVAGVVRRNLSTAGFEINKSPGFGNKREMLQAYKEAS